MTELTACFLQFLSAIYTEAGSSQLYANTLGIITVLVTFALCMIAISNIIGIEKICDNMLIIKIRLKGIRLCFFMYIHIRKDM